MVAGTRSSLALQSGNFAYYKEKEIKQAMVARVHNHLNLLYPQSAFRNAILSYNK
jgi:hypothetical protein